MVEEFREGIEVELKRDFDLMTALSIMGINPEWFVDGRTVELIEMYYFYHPHPHTAFPVKFADQPHIWIEAKFLLDALTKTPSHAEPE